MISADEINQLAIELGELGNTLVDVGVATVRKALEVGEALTIKKAEIDRDAPGTWVAWCAENLKFTYRSAVTYRDLYADVKRVSHGLETGDITSLRTAMALVYKERGTDKPVETVQCYGAVKEPEEAPDPSLAKMKGALDRFRSWLFKNPDKSWTPKVRDEFLIDLAGRERIRRQNGWDLPVIDVESETVS